MKYEYSIGSAPPAASGVRKVSFELVMDGKGGVDLMATNEEGDQWFIVCITREGKLHRYWGVDKAVVVTDGSERIALDDDDTL